MTAPCIPVDPPDCDHEWKTVDDSFDHEFGTEIVVYDQCEKCGATRPHERYEGPEDDLER